MKKPTLKQTAIAVAMILTASTATTARVSAAADTSAKTSSPTAKTDEIKAAKQKSLVDKELNEEHEALEAVTGTQQAVLALQKKDTKKATVLLQDVSGKLDIMLAKHPDLNLIPADVEVDVVDFDGDSKQVQKMIDDARELLEDHKVQDARRQLAELVSEMRITTTSIPLGTYPLAIKEAASLIEKGKTGEAENALYDVLNMLVKTTEIIPLPVLRAETMLSAASELEHKSDLKKETSRTEILKLTNAAKDKLKLAEILGYGGKEDYKQLYDAIDDIKGVIHSKKSAAVWDKIKNSLSALKNKIVHPSK